MLLSLNPVPIGGARVASHQLNPFVMALLKVQILHRSHWKSLKRKSTAYAAANKPEHPSCAMAATIRSNNQTLLKSYTIKKVAIATFFILLHQFLN